jgi:predicted O-methyltransferase YrrM
MHIKFNSEDYEKIIEIADSFCKDITDQFGCDIAEILISTLKPKTYAEIGSHAGRSAFFASVASSEFETEIYCFDKPNAGWGGVPNTQLFLEKTLNTVAHNRYQIYYGDSHSDLIKEKIKEKIYDLFLIDGDHSPDGMMADFAVVWENVRSQGLIIIDDLFHHPDLDVAFDKIILDYKIDTYIKYINSDAIDYSRILHRGVGIIQKP